MWVFIVFYGLDWVATVPPTVALCRSHFGLADSGVVFGWVFASHMVGAGVGASVAGWVRTSQGDYHWAWVVAAALCFASVAITLSIPKVREGTDRRAGTGQPTRVTTPVARASSASLASLSGSLASTSCAWRATAYVCSRAAAIARVRPQQAEGLGEPASSSRSGEQLLQPGVGGVGRGEHVRARQRALALAQVGAGRSCRSRRPRTRCR